MFSQNNNLRIQLRIIQLEDDCATSQSKDTQTQLYICMKTPSPMMTQILKLTNWFLYFDFSILSLDFTDFSRRSFSYSAPVIWNSLPSNILLCNSDSVFRKHLKTFLFSAAWLTVAQRLRSSAYGAIWISLLLLLLKLQLTMIVITWYMQQ